MFAKTIILCTVVAAAAAITPGYLDGALALGAQSEHTVRGFAGLSSVSKQAKAIDSPYSSVRKTDIRVTNDGAYGYAAPAFGYASPALAHHGYAAPALAHHGYAAPALAHHGYAAPALAHHGYAAPALAHHHGYAAPALGHPVAHGLGVAYSPATAVATSTFSGYGIHYGY
ncbi:pupal cuticle protein C1B [Folsomia candida]|uniref:Larval/pupal cuticle protein H1C n=1 Tax=Folsomia candida TaxID=158441 RepID=A0A226F520_FOLCA|nr:pupal cuticle protein C1B [Folsomia candida]OXA64528.1 Larval/pupal cuticle protein H1C [Folsomia candida]